MKQYIAHPTRDEVLEFDVPDDAVYLAVGGSCPVHGGSRRLVEIDEIANDYQCGIRPQLPLDRHKGIPPVGWYATIPNDGPASARIQRPGESTTVYGRVISGGEYARSRSA